MGLSVLILETANTPPSTVKKEVSGGGEAPKPRVKPAKRLILPERKRVDAPLPKAPAGRKMTLILGGQAVETSETTDNQTYRFKVKADNLKTLPDGSLRLEIQVLQ